MTPRRWLPAGAVAYGGKGAARVGSVAAISYALNATPESLIAWLRRTIKRLSSRNYPYRDGYITFGEPIRRPGESGADLGLFDIPVTYYRLRFPYRERGERYAFSAGMVWFAVSLRDDAVVAYASTTLSEAIPFLNDLEDSLRRKWQDAKLIERPAPNPDTKATDCATEKRSQSLTPSQRKRRENIVKAHALKAQGKTRPEISYELGVRSLRTVDSYLDADPDVQ